MIMATGKSRRSRSIRGLAEFDISQTVIGDLSDDYEQDHHEKPASQ